MQEVNNSNYLEKLFTDEVKGTLNKTSGGDSGGSYGWTTQNKELITEILKTTPEEIMIFLAKDGLLDGSELVFHNARLVYFPEDEDDGPRYVGEVIGTFSDDRGAASGTIKLLLDEDLILDSLQFIGKCCYDGSYSDLTKYFSEFTIIAYKGAPVPTPPPVPHSVSFNGPTQIDMESGGVTLDAIQYSVDGGVTFNNLQMDDFTVENVTTLHILCTLDRSAYFTINGGAVIELPAGEPYEIPSWIGDTTIEIQWLMFF